ncbi:MAG: hypothetical protein AAF620_07210 [Bacteroidota bacterium]
MKKLLIVLAILLLAGSGYFAYEKWVKYSAISSWSFIPADAAMVFEVELLRDYSTLSGYPIWKNLKEMESFAKIDQAILFLDSINGSGGLTTIFRQVPMLISMHKISRNDLDFLYVLAIQNISQNTFIGATIGHLKESGYRFKTRNYNGYKITEISKDRDTFTCIFYKNYLLASFTPYLVEDAIRTIKGDQIPYMEKFRQEENLPTSGLLDIHVNYEQSSKLLSGISNNKINLPFKNGNFTTQVDSGFISISGFSYADKGWINTQVKQPSGFDMAEVIPENTAYVLHISSTDMSSWKEKQMEYISSWEPDVKAYQDSLKRSFDFNVDQVLDLVDKEIGIVQLESGSSRENNRMCILKLASTENSLNFFKHLTERIAHSRGDTVYMEPYSENEIKYLPIKNFPVTFLGEIAGSFDQSFYINYRNYLIIANDLQELKDLISSIQNEDTWAKSLRINEFLQRANNAANLSLFINIPRTTKIIKSNVSSSWREHFETNLSTYQNFEFAAFQFSYLDNRYFTNFTFSQPTVKPKNLLRREAETGLSFKSPLITRPFLIETHIHQDLDMIVQDSARTIYYLDQNLKTLWSKEIDGKIVSDIFPIDYYKNGKLQCVFATNTSVHIWDRTGQSIPGFPKSLNDINISHFNLIDYDLSRKYRMAVTDSEGRVYLTDKDLNPLEGWKPRNFERAALTPLVHKRLGGRDIMLSVQENGIINVSNRRGENMTGFPFETGQRLDRSYFIRSGNSLGNSSMTVISEAGEFTELTLEGDVIQRNQLIKTSAETKFQLVPDREGRSFLIVRSDGSTYDVLDDTGNLLFKKDYFSNEPIFIQYYEFGAGKDLVTFTDTSTENLYLYDKSGNLVTGNPLNSAHEVNILYSSVSSEFHVFTTWGSNLELYTFKY